MSVIDYSLRRRIAALEEAVGEGGGGGGTSTVWSKLADFNPPVVPVDNFWPWEDGPAIHVPANVVVAYAFNREVHRDEDGTIMIPYVCFTPDDPGALDATILADVAGDAFIGDGTEAATHIVDIQVPSVTTGAWRTTAPVVGTIVRGFDFTIGMGWYNPAATPAATTWRNMTLAAIGL